MTNRVIRLQNIDDMTKLFRNAFTHTAVEKPPIGLKAFIKHKNFYLNLTHYGAVIPTQEELYSVEEIKVTSSLVIHLIVHSWLITGVLKNAFNL